MDFTIPANDDASKSIQLITNYLVEAIKEGLAERKKQKKKMKLKTETDKSIWSSRITLKQKSKNEIVNWLNISFLK